MRHEALETPLATPNFPLYIAQGAKRAPAQYKVLIGGDTHTSNGRYATLVWTAPPAQASLCKR